MRAAGAVIGLVLATELLFSLAGRWQAPLTFDVGPSTGGYLSGFAESEERLPVTFRWTRERAEIALPFESGEGRAVLLLRYARFLEGHARVRIFASGDPVASFSARPGRFRTQRIEAPLREGPLRLEILVEDPHPDRLGLAVDWIRIERASWRLPLSAWAPRLLAAGAFGVFLLAGFGVGGALALSSGVALAEVSWLALDPFGMAHALSRITLPALGLAALVAAIPSTSRWLTVVFLAGYLFKGAGIFYPSYFYPDVRNHRRYIYAFAVAEGSIPERGLAAQMTVRTAYPRRVGDRVYAFPYSPLFFVPFTWLPRDPHGIEEALKHVALAASAAVALVVYGIARILLGAGPALAGALVSAFLPAAYSRLFLAMYPTVAAHLLDTLAVLAAARLSLRPESSGRLATLGGAMLASLLTYISSLFHLGAFAAAFAALERRLGLRVLAAFAAAAVVTVVLLYFSFTLTFFREILPALAAGGGTAASEGLAGRAASAGRRLVLFYGLAYPVFTVGGMALIRRAARPEAFRLFAACFLAFALLTALRISSDVFKDLKEILFVGPWVAVASGAALSVLARSGRAGRWAAGLVAAGLFAFFLGKYAGYLREYASLAGLDAVF